MSFAKLARSLSVRRGGGKMFGSSRVQQRGVATEVKIQHGLDGSAHVSLGQKELHPLWLRERCTSSQSVQDSTKQPLHEHHSLPANLTITKANVVQKTSLSVTFSDGLTSTYPISTLWNEANDFQSETIQFKKHRFIHRIYTWYYECSYFFKLLPLLLLRLLLLLLLELPLRFSMPCNALSPKIGGQFESSL